MLNKIKYNLINNFLLNKRLLKNIRSQLFFKISIIFINLIFPPIMIYLIGAEKYGLWIILLSSISIISIFFIEYDTYSAQEITNAYFKKKLLLVDKLFTNYCALKLLNIICLIFIFTFSFYFLLENNNTYLLLDNTKEIKISLIILFITYLIGYFLSIIKLSFNSLGKIYISTNLELFSNIISKILIIIAAFYFKNLILISSFYAIAILLKFFISIFFFKRLSYKFKFKLNYFEKIITKKIFFGSIQHYYVNACQILKHDLSNLILGSYLGTATVAYFNTLKTIFYFFPIRIFDILNSVLYFEYAYLFSKKNYIKLFSLHNSQKKIIYFLLSIYLVFTIFFGKYLYAIWMQNLFDLEYMLMILVMIDCILTQTFSTQRILLKSLNKTEIMNRFIFFIYLISCILLYLNLKENPNYYIYFYLNIIVSFISLIFSIIFHNKFFKNTQK